MNIENHRGQALVEFVIILPIFIFMLLAVIDLGKILYLKNNLESRMDDVITFYESENKVNLEEKLQLNQDQIDLEIANEEDYITFELSKPTDIITPGLNLVFGKSYKVLAKRVIYDES